MNIRLANNKISTKVNKYKAVDLLIDLGGL
jgi:hypothetical protein